MLKTFLLAACLLALTGLSARPMPQPAGVWHTAFSTAQAEARKHNKPLLVDFYADWCGYCRKLRQFVYPHKDFVQAAKPYVRVTLNGEKHRKLMRRYRVRGFPTVVLLDRNGYLLERVDGMARTGRFVERLRSGLKKADLEQRLLLKARNAGDRLANYQLALYYSEVRDARQARTYYLRAFRAPEGNPDLRRDALYNAAVSSMTLSDFGRGVELWTNYITEYPARGVDFTYAHLYRGICRHKLGNPGLARADLLFAIRHLPRGRDRQRARRYLGKPTTSPNR